MNQVLKFRVWDKDYQRMHICGEEGHDSMSFITDDNIACYYNLQNGCGSLPDGDGEYELMKFTGLHDGTKWQELTKEERSAWIRSGHTQSEWEGREIYEGDLVKFRRIHFTDCAREEIEEIDDPVIIEIISHRPIASIVKPHSEGLRAFGWDIENHEAIVLGLLSEELKVIGNVHKNPELVKHWPDEEEDDGEELGDTTAGRGGTGMNENSLTLDEMQVVCEQYNSERIHTEDEIRGFAESSRTGWPEAIRIAREAMKETSDHQDSALAYHTCMRHYLSENIELREMTAAMYRTNNEKLVAADRLKDAVQGVVRSLPELWGDNVHDGRIQITLDECVLDMLIGAWELYREAGE